MNLAESLLIKLFLKVIITLSNSNITLYCLTVRVRVIVNKIIFMLKVYKYNFLLD